MRKLIPLSIVLASCFLLVACLRPVQQSTQSAIVSGKVTTDANATLPTDATIIVQLRDTSAGAAHGNFVGQQQIATNGNQLPIAFEITYPPASINQASTYVVFAIVQDSKGQLLMASQDGAPVLTNGNPTKDVTVPVTPPEQGAAASDNAAAAPATEANELAGSSWDAFLMNAGGADLVSITGVQITAEFGADGQLSGFSGCNNYSATYTAGAGAIKIGPIAATQKACSEPANVMEQESQYLAALQSAVTYQVQDQLLQMQAASGQAAVQFNQTNE